MKEDQVRWDDRYKKNEYSSEPSEIVKDFAGLAKKDNALDIATGNGRNALFLASLGYRVDAIDISNVALEKIRQKNGNIGLIHEDLDFYQPKIDYYDLVININFLQRRLFPYIIDSLKNKGILIFRTFLAWKLNEGDGPPKRKDHYLKRNELLHSFLSLQVIYYREEEKVMRNGQPQDMATLVARKKTL